MVPLEDSSISFIYVQQLFNNPVFDQLSSYLQDQGLKLSSMHVSAHEPIYWKPFIFQTNWCVTNLVATFIIILVTCHPSIIVQMWMSVLQALIAVMTMQLATTVQGVTSARVTLDMQAMVSYALVSISVFQSFQMQLDNPTFPVPNSDINECLSNNGGCNHNCHNSDGSYTCSCNNGYQLNSDGHTCEGKLYNFCMQLCHFLCKSCSIMYQ